MTQLEINEYKAAASLGLIPDEENPLFLFSTTHTDLLVEIVGGGIDAKQLAYMELRARGLNKEGLFVGFR